jgi:predicted Zn-dependent peptidase
MMRLARNEISYGHQVPERELIDRIDSVSLDDVRALARDLFDVEAFTLVSLGPSVRRL